MHFCVLRIVLRVVLRVVLRIVLRIVLKFKIEAFNNAFLGFFNFGLKMKMIAKCSSKPCDCSGMGLLIDL